MLSYSTVVDPVTYETEGLCDGIEVRISSFTDLEDRGAIRAHHDWNKYVEPCREYRGTLGPKYSFMSLTVPECLPDRLEVISYANEFAFLHDDVTDQVDFERGEVENNEMMNAFLEAAHTGSIDSSASEAARAGKKRIQSQLFLEMLSIDPECAKTTMKAWARFVEVGSSRKHETRFQTLDEYLPYRIMDVGEMFWYGVVTFGLSLRIPDHEMDLCRKLMAPAWIAVGLQNDLWSWPKERDAAEKQGKDHVINAIWVLMHEHKTDLEGAEQICRRLIKENVAKYLQIVKECRDDASLSEDLRKYIEAMKYSISGNVVWSLTCPRYNPQVSFNERQIRWMHEGVPELETSCSSPEAESVSSSSPVFSETHSKDGADLGDKVILDRISSQSSFSTPPEMDDDEYQVKVGPQLAYEKEILEAPYKYIASLPSKGVRDRFIDALNNWLRVPHDTLEKILVVTRLLHNASLIMDDFQDDSPLRRGKVAAHTIFGPAQAINASTYTIVKAINQVAEFRSQCCVHEMTEKIMALFQGQAMDLFWTYNSRCPTMNEYYRMVDNKTGQLFSIVTRLMLDNHKCISTKTSAALDKFTTLLGRYFQVRDDYQNLASADYTKQKGFCEDLDEGKYSVPLIYTLQTQPDNIQLISLLSTGKKTGTFTREQKECILEILEKSGGLAYTRVVLLRLHDQASAALKKLELSFGSSNPEMKVLLELLRI
ncbi:fusicoccadiene synthase [Colletotrichum tabaci]|uniref:Fusicoccadiene synthase n=1 Tax=Colletotrichum tabaci TaxID=1209068 RepID=A0AAV9T6I0_9PEZI